MRLKSLDQQQTKMIIRQNKDPSDQSFKQLIVEQTGNAVVIKSQKVNSATSNQLPKSQQVSNNNIPVLAVQDAFARKRSTDKQNRNLSPAKVSQFTTQGNTRREAASQHNIKKEILVKRQVVPAAARNSEEVKYNISSLPTNSDDGDALKGMAPSFLPQSTQQLTKLMLPDINQKQIVFNERHLQDKRQPDSARLLSTEVKPPFTSSTLPGSYKHTTYKFDRVEEDLKKTQKQQKLRGDGELDTIIKESRRNSTLQKDDQSTNPVFHRDQPSLAYYPNSSQLKHKKKNKKKSPVTSSGGQKGHKRISKIEEYKEIYRILNQFSQQKLHQSGQPSVQSDQLNHMLLMQNQAQATSTLTYLSKASSNALGSPSHIKLVQRVGSSQLTGEKGRNENSDNLRISSTSIPSKQNYESGGFQHQSKYFKPIHELKRESKATDPCFRLDQPLNGSSKLSNTTQEDQALKMKTHSSSGSLPEKGNLLARNINQFQQANTKIKQLQTQQQLQPLSNNYGTVSFSDPGLMSNDYGTQKKPIKEAQALSRQEDFPIFELAPLGATNGGSKKLQVTSSTLQSQFGINKGYTSTNRNLNFLMNKFPQDESQRIDKVIKNYQKKIEEEPRRYQSIKDADANLVYNFSYTAKKAQSPQDMMQSRQTFNNHMQHILKETSLNSPQASKQIDGSSPIQVGVGPSLDHTPMLMSPKGVKTPFEQKGSLTTVASFKTKPTYGPKNVSSSNQQWIMQAVDQNKRSKQNLVSALTNKNEEAELEQEAPQEQFINPDVPKQPTATHDNNQYLKQFVQSELSNDGMQIQSAEFGKKDFNVVKPGTNKKALVLLHGNPEDKLQNYRKALKDSESKQQQPKRKKQKKIVSQAAKFRIINGNSNSLESQQVRIGNNNLQAQLPKPPEPDKDDILCKPNLSYKSVLNNRPQKINRGQLFSGGGILLQLISNSNSVSTETIDGIENADIVTDQFSQQDGNRHESQVEELGASQDNYINMVMNKSKPNSRLKIQSLADNRVHPSELVKVNNLRSKIDSTTSQNLTKTQPTPTLLDADATKAYDTFQNEVMQKVVTVKSRDGTQSQLSKKLKLKKARNTSGTSSTSVSSPPRRFEKIKAGASRSEMTPFNQQQKQQLLQTHSTVKATKSQNTKRKPQIYFLPDPDDTIDSHPINQAITTINNIVRMIFKNKGGDSLALTTSSAQSLGSKITLKDHQSEMNRLQDLQKICKTMNISIPKKFDSKTSFREFFYSRDFVLTLKIKMNLLLHRAILNANNIPLNIIEKSQQNIQTIQTAGAEPGSNMTTIQTSPQKTLQVKDQNNTFQNINVSKKFWIGRANNGAVVKNVLKQRYWWQNASEENFEEADFIWTSWKKQKHIDYLNYQNHLAQHKPVATENSDSKSEPSENEDALVLPLRLYNKLEQNKQLTNKKGQDPFKVLPLTFHTRNGTKDPEFKKFEQFYNSLESQRHEKQKQLQKAIKSYRLHKNRSLDSDSDYSYEEDGDTSLKEIKRKYRMPINTWIIKPGENTNQGNGIQVCQSLAQIKNVVNRTAKENRTYIIQKYIDYPLLVHRRKFDLRCFGMLTSINGSLKGYFYHDGYVRTSCKEFSLDDIEDKFVHLTNDMIQKKAVDYGKFENGNKMSFQDFSKVIRAQEDIDFDMHRDIVPQIRKIVGDTFKSVISRIDPARLQNTFELFGYDFMIDDNYKLHLIEVNTNPSLEICCPLLARVIPEVLENCFRIVLDPLFPSPDLSQGRKFQLNELPQEVKFSLVFDERTQGEMLKNQEKSDAVIKEEDIESDQEDQLEEDDEYD